MQTSNLRSVVLNPDFPHQLLTISVGHKKRGAIGAGAGLQGADTKFGTTVLPFKFGFKPFYRMILEKILHNDGRLRTAVAVAFGRQLYFNIIIKVFCQFGGISVAKRSDHIIHPSGLRKSSKEKKSAGTNEGN